MSLLFKTWDRPDSGFIRYASGSLMYQLSRLLEKKDYDVVMEGHLDVKNEKSGTPDVVVYNRQLEYTPVMMIEFAEPNSLEATLDSVERLSEKHHVPEAFVINLEDQQIFRVKDRQRSRISFSERLGLDLGKVLDTSLFHFA